MNNDKKKLLESIKKAALVYKEHYQGKNFLIFYRNQSKQLEYKQVVFSKKHFLHLTGVIYNETPNKLYFKDTRGAYHLDSSKNKVYLSETEAERLREGNNNTYYIQGPAESFYKKCLNNIKGKPQGGLSLRTIESKADGTTQQKLDVFPQLAFLMNCPSLVGYFNSNGYNLYADYFLGNTKKTVALGFCEDDNYDIPKSLLSKNPKQVMSDPCSVIAIFSKGISDKQYTQCYESKALPLTNYSIPKHLKPLLIHKSKED